MQLVDQPPEILTSARPGASRPPGLKILCIDDDPHVINALAQNFEARGATVLCAFHGMQGFWLACSESPDVIITDMLMPRGDGDYVVECLKRNASTRSIPVVVLSGVGVQNLERMVKDLDVDGVFTKPVQFAALYRAICALV